QRPIRSLWRSRCSVSRTKVFLPSFETLLRKRAMFVAILHRLVPPIFRHGLRNRSWSTPRRAPRFKPWLEALETLTLPSTVTWINPNGGNWGLASNRDAGHVPGIRGLSEDEDNNTMHV